MGELLTVTGQQKSTWPYTEMLFSANARLGTEAAQLLGYVSTDRARHLDLCLYVVGYLGIYIVSYLVRCLVLGTSLIFGSML